MSIVCKGNFKDPDGTVKSVYEADNKIIEISFIRTKIHKNIDIFCVPTYYNCKLGCTFCHLTGNCTDIPMQKINAVDLMECILATNKNFLSPSRKCLISYMGIGEPFSNTNLLYEMNETVGELKERAGYSDVSYALATIIPDEKSLSEFTDYVIEHKIPVKIHFSLHTPFTVQRHNMIPSSCITVAEAFDSLADYRQRVMNSKEIMDNFKLFHNVQDPTEIHYTLIDGVNDSDDHLRELIELENRFYIPIKFLRYNPVPNTAPSNKTSEWINAIRTAIPELEVSEYCPPGTEIGSSCGQFTPYFYMKNMNDEAKTEFNEWRNRYSC